MCMYAVFDSTLFVLYTRFHSRNWHYYYRYKHLYKIKITYICRHFYRAERALKIS